MKQFIIDLFIDGIYLFIGLAAGIGVSFLLAASGMITCR